MRFAAATSGARVPQLLKRLARCPPSDIVALPRRVQILIAAKEAQHLIKKHWQTIILTHMRSSCQKRASAADDLSSKGDWPTCDIDQDLIILEQGADFTDASETKEDIIHESQIVCMMELLECH
jgi:hypothetical protein